MVAKREAGHGPREAWPGVCHGSHRRLARRHALPVQGRTAPLGATALRFPFYSFGVIGPSLWGSFPYQGPRSQPPGATGEVPKSGALLLCNCSCGKKIISQCQIMWIGCCFTSDLEAVKGSQTSCPGLQQHVSGRRLPGPERAEPPAELPLGRPPPAAPPRSTHPGRQCLQGAGPFLGQESSMELPNTGSQFPLP